MPRTLMSHGLPANRPFPRSVSSMLVRRFPRLRFVLSLAVGLTTSAAFAQPADSVRSSPSNPAQGGLTAEQIRTVIQANIMQVQQCYEQALEHSPALEGRVIVAFSIAPDGHVSESTVAHNSMGNAQVGECIARAAGTWIYPRPEPAGVVSVRFPFNLHNSDTWPNPVDRLPGGAHLWSGIPRLRSPLADPSSAGVSDAALVARIEVGTRRVQSLPRGAPSRAAALLAVADAYIARAVGLETALDELRRRASSLCVGRADAGDCDELDARIHATAATLQSVYRPSNATMGLIVRDHPELPELDRVLFALGHGLQGDGEDARSAQIFLALVERYPSSSYGVFALETMGRSAFDAGRFEEASDAFRRALARSSAIGPIRAHLLMFLAGSEAALGRPEAALRHLDEAESARASSRTASSPYRVGDDAIVDDIRRRARAAFETAR